MKDLEDNMYHRLQYEQSYNNQEESPCNGVENVSIIVHKKKVKNRKKYQSSKYGQPPAIAFRLSRSGTLKNRKLVKKHSSLPEINDRPKLLKPLTKSSNVITRGKKYNLNTKYVVNRVSEYYFNNNVSPFNYPTRKKWKVYRCQLSTQEESCCCSCNSDAMFEVMKSLYDCYKKKNCDNCNCILCGHLPREERRMGRIRKSLADVGLAGSEKERKEKIKKAEKQLEGKSTAEKEKILKELAKSGQPLPKGKTASEKELMKKIRTELGLPPEPKTAAEKEKIRKAEAAGLITPLEGKTTAQKEKILKAQAELGIELPEGRTASERALIQKVKTAAGIPIGITSEKLRKAKEAGLLTPLEGKSAEKREKIIRGLAMQGLPLPEGKTASERKIIDKVRADLGLPPEPKTLSMKEKYAKAANAGLMQPLEGKSNKEKEKILQGLADLGIPLPEGRTASERSLIAKVKAKAAEPLEYVAPSEKIRRAKAAGLITPIEGKPPEQQEKILRGLAMQGILLPEGKTASEKRLIDKVRADLGLPPEPKSSSMKAKYAKAADAGLLQPLEGKTHGEKEKILQGLHDLGIPLPEGRTASERSLIAKVKAKAAEPLEYVAPSEKIRRAKAAGLITPIEGKPPEQQEKILRGLAMQGILLPEGKTASEKRLIDKVRADLGLPPEPKSSSMKAKYAKAADAGLLQPLEGKTHGEKEKILQGLHDLGIPLPEGRTASERSLIAKVKAKAAAPLEQVAPSEKIRRAKAAGLLTPIEGKPPDQQEKILRGLAMQGILLPEGKTAPEKRLIDKVRADLGLPPEPKSSSMKAKYAKAADAGLLQPLEGKTHKEKEKILQGLHDLGIPLPEGRTASERSLIAKVKAKAAAPLEQVAPSEKIRRAKAAGLLTPIEGKPPDQQEKILRGLAMQGILLPEGKTAPEKRLIDKVRADLGLPPEPKSSSMKAKYAKAADAGLLQPLEGKTHKEKEKILQGLHDLGIPLPEGRTASERSLIAKVKAKAAAPLEQVAPSEKIRRAKAAGLLTPIEGKPPQQQEKILRGLAMQGILLPEGKTASEKRLIDKVRADLGLPPEPKTSAMKARYAKAADAGLLQPLEGKTHKEKEKILQGLHDLGIPLPEGRTASERSLIAKVKAGAPEPVAPAPSEKLRKAKAAGLLTPLEGKAADQKEKILRGLAMQGIPLPEGKTASEKKLIDKVRNELGLPPEPKTQSMRDKYNRAADAGFMQPLEGKSSKEKEKVLQGLYDMGIPLPEGRTKSEKALVAKIKAGPKPPTLLAPSEKLRKAKAAGLLTPLEGKPTAQKEKILRGLAMQGIPLPEAKTSSERNLTDKVRLDLGLPPEPKTPSMRERYARAADAGILKPLEGKTTKEKEKILQGLYDMGIPLPEGRTASEKSLIARIKEKAKPPPVLAQSEKMRKAKAAGLLTPLEGKTPEHREKILKGLAMQGIPLPEGKSASEKMLIDKVRNDLGLPPEPQSRSMREKYSKAADAGLLQPLEGKSAREKEKILRGLHDMGIPLPEGRTKSEKSLIAKIKARPPPAPAVLAPSEKLRKAKAAGLLTPLEGKTPEQREKILRGLAMQGIPLPEGKTSSEKRIIDKVRADIGLPPEPKTQSMRSKYARAADAGLMQPLEGKSHKEKEKILQGLHNLGISLPEGRTASEKALIAKIQAESRPPSVLAPSEKLRKAKAAGLLTPLADKSPAQREKILRGLAMQGVPLPEAKTASEQKLIDKVRSDLGLPPEPKTQSMRDRYNRAADAGLLQPLEGKSHKQKERMLQGLHDMGIPLPEGRTASEKALVAKITAAASGAPPIVAPSEKLRRAKAAGLLTPLEGKTSAQKEKILRGLAMQGLPLPEGKTASERKLVDKVRADLGLPPEPKTPSMKEKYEKAANAGLLQPLEGKTDKEKQRILQGLHNMGIPLPEGRTASEKALIANVKAAPRLPTMLVPSEKLRKAQAAGLLTPLEGKTPAQREKILRGLAMQGIPLPEGKTSSEKMIVEKVRADLGLPPSPTTAAEKEKYNKAVAAGLITPLEGKTQAQKERILREQHNLGLPLPNGRTASEKALIKKIQREKEGKRTIGVGAPALPPDKRRKLDEKTAKVMKEGKGPADECICGLLTPESERETPPLPAIPSEKLRAARAAGLLTPLEGKSPEQKEKILRELAKQGIPLPEAKTASEKKLMEKVRSELGLPPEPKTASMKEKYAKAQAAGIMTPLEGKSASQKEKILKAQAEMGVPLPEGRTASEKALIAKIKATKAPSITTEKLKKAKEAGLLTPLEGKTEEQRAKILKGLATAGLPLPEGRTASEKMLIKKIKTELGVPEPTPSEKVRKAKLAGLLTPLDDKTLSQREKILRGRAAAGLPLPVGKTASERALVQKIKKDTGYVTPPPSERMRRAKAAGLLTPLEGKTTAEKEKILRDRLAAGVPIPEGKTPSEKEIIRKITAEAPPTVRPSERMRKAQAAGVLTPLEGKSPEKKEKIIRGLIKAGVPLPEPKTASEKSLIDKIRHEVGLPPEPKTPSLKEKYRKAHEAGLITPLEGKSKADKEKVLRRLHEAGIPLPEGRTSSEKSMIKRIKAEIPERKIPSEKIRAARAAGLLTPLEGKTASQKEKIIRGLAEAGIPIPEAKTASEKAIIQKVRTELGLPPEPASASMKEKMRRAQAQGIITPLEGKTSAQKEQILKNLADAGIPLPEGRTASEKALIAKVRAESRGRPTKITSEKMKKAKAAGLLTPLTGKTATEKERIMKGLVAQGLPLPETHTESERKIAEKIRKDLGLPPEPKSSSEKARLHKAEAAGIVTPLEGKTHSQKERILKDMAAAGVALPEGRTKSEKAMIKRIKEVPTSVGPPPLPPTERRKLDEKTAKVMKEDKGPSDECICGLLTPESEREEPTKAPTRIPSEKLRKAKAAGLLTPLEGKSSADKERILRGLAKEGIPLPDARTSSERKIGDKIRKELGLPPEPKTRSMKEKHQQAAAAGVLVPLESLSPAEKERVLRAQADLGIQLPEGRTASEKALIAKIKAEKKLPPSRVASEKIRKAKAAGLLTPLEGKSGAEREKILKGLAKEGLPLPDAKTSSERKIIDKVRKELGLPPEPKTQSMKERHEKAAAAGVLVPLEGLSPAEKERVLRAQADLGIQLPEGRTASEKALIAKVKADSKRPLSRIASEKIRKAKEAGLLTPLEGKSAAEREKIVRGLAIAGLPLPEAKTSSERKITDKIRQELGLPPEPKTRSMKERQERAAAAGVLVPLEGLSPAEKEKVLRDQADLGIQLPEGRTSSEKALIAKVKAESKRPPSKIASEKIRKAKAAGLLTPLEGKSAAAKEKIIRGLAKEGLPLPEAKTSSERKITDKIRQELGLPPEPKTRSMKEKQERAAAAGVLVPLEGLSPAEKEKVLRDQADLGIQLPEGRTSSEKALIAKVKAESKRPPTKMPSEQIRKAKAAGLLTPLEGKSAAEKEKILRGLAKEGIPLPEAKTTSERKLAHKIRKELGLPPEPKTASMKERQEKAAAAGVLVPLEGLSPAEKERVLKAQADMGLELPEGRTASERALVAKVKAESKLPPSRIASDRIRKAKTAGLLTPLLGKSASEKERILRGLAKQGLPLPTAHTSSERKIADKIRKELGLPPEPKTASMQEQHDKAAAAGVLVPLEGLSPAEKERVLRTQADLGIPLPEGRTASEKSLIARIKAESKLPPSKIASERIQKAKAAGLLTPLKGKKAAEKERIMRGLAKEGLPLPEAKTTSERKIADKIRKEVGLPPEPKTPSMRQKYEKAAAAGILVPLDGLTPAEKERVLRAQAEMGIPLPEGRTSSEKSLIAKIKAEIEPSLIPSAKLKKAKAAGLLTPLEGKSHAQKEKIIRSLAEAGLPLPEGKTASEKALIHKVRTELGIPPPARTASEKAVVRKAKAEGLLTPIAGKSAKEKERIIKGLAEAGLPIPEGKTASEKELIKKIRTSAGLPPEPTPSEKRGEIKTKSKRVGVTASRKLKAKGIGVGGMTAEYEDILKSTTCDRGCGCDKKKIRFKHSYVKIRVTSPDISSLCPCPDECIPGVKAGAFIDNEGIKVTVGRVDGVTSYTSQYSNHILESSKHIITIYDKILSNRRSINSSSAIVDALLNNNTVPNNLQQTTDDAVPSQRCVDNNSKMNHGQLYSSSSYSSVSYDSYKPYIKDRIEESNSNDRWIDGSGRFLDATGYLETLGEIYRSPVLMSFSSDDTTELSSLGSFESILVIKSESSLSLTSTSSVDVISVISFSNSSSGSNSTHYLYYPVSGGNFSDSTVEELECLTNKVDYIAADTVTSQSNSLEFTAGQDETHTNVNGNSNETASAIRRRHNEYLTFRMSQMKFSQEIPMTKMSTRKTNTGEPVIVINNLNSEHDIKTMVDQLLSKNEFSDASSIFVVVPTSDDNDSDHSINSVNSTICIQVSEQLNNWHRNKSHVEERLITPSHMVSATRGLRISRHGRKYFIEGIHDTVTIVHNKETLVDCPKGYVYTGQRSKLSEFSTGRLLSNRYNVASTDTTADRPCCCAPKIKKDAVQNLNSNHRCVANVVSELITPLLVNQGLGRDPYRGMTTLALNQQPSFISMNRPPTPVGACRVPPCAGRTGCHQSSDMYQIPVKPPAPPPQPENQSKPCQCSPEKLKEMLEQAVKAGKAINTKSTACGGAASKPSPVSLTPPAPKPTDPENDCAACSKHKYKDGVTMQCVCNGKKKTVKLHPLCPCEQHQPPISNTATGPKTGTRSLGCQCCICAEGPSETCAKKFFGLLNKKPTPKVGYLEVLGPAGGLAQMEKEGTYTQAGRRDLPTKRDTTAESSTNTKKKCVCSDKRGKKKKNVICECPPAPIEPEPEILEMTMASPLDFSYEELKKYQLYEQKLAMKQKSDMTQTLSGFKVLKKKKPPTSPELEFTVEDAVRYYATLHPDLLKDLCPPPPDFREEDCSCEDNKPAKKTKHDVDCSCPYEPPPPPPPPPEPEPVKEDEGPFRGLKFRMGGKGSGSRGLGGVCCFDMVEELNISRQRSDER